MERRAAQRTQVTLNLACRIPAAPRRVTIHDVSTTGCKIELRDAPLELGATALLEMPGSDRVAGRIIWNHGNVAGVQFERPLGRAAATAFGIAVPEPGPEPEPIVVPASAERPLGLLGHWFRRLTGRFA